MAYLHSLTFQLLRNFKVCYTACTFLDSMTRFINFDRPTRLLMGKQSPRRHHKAITRYFNVVRLSFSAPPFPVRSCFLSYSRGLSQSPNNSLAILMARLISFNSSAFMSCVLVENLEKCTTPPDNYAVSLLLQQATPNFK
jgi:hypothetical protein